MPGYTRREFVAAVGAGTALSLTGTVSAQDSGTPPETTPPKRGHLLYTSDPSNIAVQQAGHHLGLTRDPRFARDNPARAEDLIDFVDAIANSGFDSYAQAVFSQGWTLYHRSPNFEYDARPHHQRFVPMMDAGVVPLQVLIDRTHERGMEFVAKFRMNDAHGSGKQGANFVTQNQQWWLPEIPGSLDYSIEAVRDFMLAAADEIVTRFDVDGLLFNYLRHMHCFPRSVAHQRQPVMTEFLRRVRRMIDQRAKEKRKSLSLGVMVPQTMEECHGLGYDVPTWMREGLVNYVCPSDAGWPDFNARYEDYTQYSDAAGCLVYPMVTANLCRGDNANLLRPENFRALAQNFYGAGAHGVTAFNYQHYWGRRMGIDDYPGPPESFQVALSYLTELKDPQAVVSAIRHYRFHPLWGGPSWSRYEKNDRLVLPRRDGASKTYRFRMCEGGNTIRAHLYFTAQGLTPADIIEVSINGQRIDKFRRVYHATGRPEKWGRPIPAHSTVFFDVPPRFLTARDNQLGVTLTRSATEQDEIVVDEVEVVVEPKTT